MVLGDGVSGPFFGPPTPSPWSNNIKAPEKPELFSTYSAETSS